MRPARCGAKAPPDFATHFDVEDLASPPQIDFWTDLYLLHDEAKLVQQALYRLWQTYGQRHEQRGRRYGLQVIFTPLEPDD